MDSITESAKLIVEAEAKGFAEVDARIKQLKVDLDDNLAAYRSGTRGVEEYIQAGRRLDAELAQLSAAHKLATDTLARHKGSTADAAAALGNLGRGARGAQERFTALSYGMSDFFSVSGNLSQRLNSIANNVPRMFAGMSPAMVNFGLALSGILPVLALIANNWETFGKAFTDTVKGMIGEANWTKLAEAVGMGVDRAKDHLDTLTDRIKELESKDHKVAVDYRDLAAARAEADRLKEGLQLIERLRKHQSESEEASGKAVKETLETAPGGTAGVVDALRGQFQEELLNATSGPLAKTRAEIAGSNRQIAALRERILRGGGDLHSGDELESLEARVDRLKDLMFTQQENITRPRGEAAQKAGDLVLGAVEGHGPDQAASREELARRLGRAGRATLGQAIRTSTPEQARVDKEFERETEDQLEQEKKDTAAAKKAAADRERVQRNAIAVATSRGAIEATADRLATEVNARGLNAEESFLALKAAIQSEIVASLVRQKVTTEKVEELAGDAAAQEAGQAFGRVGRAGQKQAREAAKGEKQDVKDEQSALLAEAKANEAALDEEVKRINDTLGKRLQSDFERITATNAAMIERGAPVVGKARDIRDREQLGQVAGVNFAVPPEVLGQILGRQMVQILRANKFGEGASNLAAARIADRGGVDLLRQQAARRPLIRPGARPGVRARPRVAPKPGPKPKVAPRPAPFVGPPKPPPAPKLDPRSLTPARPAAAPAADARAALAPVAGQQRALAEQQKTTAALVARVKDLEAANRRQATEAAQQRARLAEHQPTASNYGTA